MNLSPQPNNAKEEVGFFTPLCVVLILKCTASSFPHQVILLAPGSFRVTSSCLAMETKHSAGSVIRLLQSPLRPCSCRFGRWTTHKAFLLGFFSDVFPLPVSHVVLIAPPIIPPRRRKLLCTGPASRPLRTPPPPGFALFGWRCGHFLCLVLWFVPGHFFVLSHWLLFVTPGSYICTLLFVVFRHTPRPPYSLGPL